MWISASRGDRGDNQVSGPSVSEAIYLLHKERERDTNLTPKPSPVLSLLPHPPRPRLQALSSSLYLDLALQVLLSEDYLKRDAEKVSVLELNSGPFIPVIHQYFDPVLLHFIV